MKYLFNIKCARILNRHYSKLLIFKFITLNTRVERMNMTELRCIAAQILSGRYKDISYLSWECLVF